jgi:predicted GNAT superfamily acetyltransferase
VPAEAVAADGQVILQADVDGAPAASPADADVLRAWIPQDIVRLRETDTQLADAWRHALRAAIGPGLRDGFRAESITRDGWLVLAR